MIRSPDVVDAILAGRTEQALMLERLERPLPAYGTSSANAYSPSSPSMTTTVGQQDASWPAKMSHGGSSRTVSRWRSGNTPRSASCPRRSRPVTQEPAVADELRAALGMPGGALAGRRAGSPQGMPDQGQHQP